MPIASFLSSLWASSWVHGHGRISIYESKINSATLLSLDFRILLQFNRIIVAFKCKKANACQIINEGARERQRCGRNPLEQARLEKEDGNQTTLLNILLHWVKNMIKDNISHSNHNLNSFQGLELGDIFTGPLWSRGDNEISACLQSHRNSNFQTREGNWNIRTQLIGAS